MKAWVVLVATLFATVSLAEELTPTGALKFEGIKEPKDLSAVVALPDGETLIVADDEGRFLQVLRLTSQGTFAADDSAEIQLNAPGTKEIDIEGLALHEGTLYVAGSQCRTRSKLDAENRTQAKNLERLLPEDEDDKPRTGVYRLEVADDGTAGPADRKNLRKALERVELLKDYQNGLTKENGIDVEGLAFDGESLYAGLRGPVLNAAFEEGPDRKYAPVVAFDFDALPAVRPLFVDLGGRGVRDLARVDDGFLVIGGPVRDEDISYELYFWDGKNGIPGEDVGEPKPIRIGTIVPPPEGMAEGVAVLKKLGDRAYEILVLFDGVEGGGPRTYRIEY